MNFLNNPSYLKEQYKDSTNLEARIALHAQFSRNKQGWMPWVFEQLELPEGGRVLELGCGPGTMWVENRERVPAGLHLTLSDYSYGMVTTARSAVQEIPFNVTFAAIDAQRLPFPDATFDTVIANHMLYHVPNRAQALAEITRVLRFGGRLHTTTGSPNNMRAMDALLRRFDPMLDDYNPVLIQFNLENGAEELAPWFDCIESRRYLDALDITAAAPLAAYIASGTRAPLVAERLAELETWLEAEIQNNGGVIHIEKDAGMFIARK